MHPDLPGRARLDLVVGGAARPAIGGNGASRPAVAAPAPEDGRPEPALHISPLQASTVPRRRLTTVMFTDIVGSTERATTLGDARWFALELAHERLIQREIRRFHGRILQSVGDGVVATFDSPASGVCCAITIAVAMRALGLDIRAGLHTGEYERRGRRLGGIIFNVGARIVALAGAGEVLVSHTVKDLVAGSGLAFIHRGAHELKGLPGEWPMYAAAPA